MGDNHSDVADAAIARLTAERDAARADLEHLKSVVFVPLSMRTGSKSYAEWHAESDAWLGKLQAELAESRAREEGLREALSGLVNKLPKALAEVSTYVDDIGLEDEYDAARRALSTGRETM